MPTASISVSSARPGGKACSVSSDIGRPETITVSQPQGCVENDDAAPYSVARLIVQYETRGGIRVRWHQYLREVSAEW